MKLKIVKCKKPKGFICTNLYFSNMNSANEYINSLNSEFLLDKAKKLEHPEISKRIRKNLLFSKPKKYLLTKVANKYLLWEQLNQEKIQWLKRKQEDQKRERRKDKVVPKIPLFFKYFIFIFNNALGSLGSQKDFGGYTHTSWCFSY